MKILFALVLAAGLAAAYLCPPAWADQIGQIVGTLSNYNGKGSTTREGGGNTTAYAAGELFAANTTGTAAASPITVTGTDAGTGLITKAAMELSGTGATTPPTIIVWLFSAPPATTSLADRSAYIGPYAADITSGIYIGFLTCASWQKTNDATAQWFSECSMSNLASGVLPFQAQANATTILALEEINGAYTPVSGETHTYLLSTLRDK